MKAIRLSAMLPIAICVVAAVSSDAGAARSLVASSHPAIEIVSSPRLQTIQTKVITRIDAKTHALRPTLMLGTARFTITVTNPSPIALARVAVSDPRSPRCNLNIGILAPGASFAFACSKANVGRSYTNVVTASGLRSTGARDFASARVAATATATSIVRVVSKLTVAHGVPSFTG